MVSSEDWIGVDLDGTLAVWSTWTKWNDIGAPIVPMVERVKFWLSEGKKVKIVTARLTITWPEYTMSMRTHTCKKTGEKFSYDDMKNAIQDWTEKHIGTRLEAQPYKDYNMVELWDDRAIQVVTNTGRTLAEEHAAELVALRGAP